MNILIAILIRIIEVMFVAGVAGSAIVVLLTSMEDFKMLFEKETSPGKCRRAVRDRIGQHRGCQPPAAQRHHRPDTFHDSERPGALQEAVNRAQHASPLNARMNQRLRFSRA